MRTVSLICIKVRRDLSLILDKHISFEEIRQMAVNTERGILKSMNVFSVFEGEQIGEDKKAYALSFFLQDAQVSPRVRDDAGRTPLHEACWTRRVE